MSVNYIDNAAMLAAVKDSKADGRINDDLAKMFLLLVKGFGRQQSWSGYTYSDDMQADALATLCRVWNRFDVEKFDNPFAFYTQCIKFQFFNSWRKEKRRQIGRDRLLVLSGMTPSTSYQLDHAAQQLQC